MLPIVFEWHWGDLSRLIFMGLLYMALGVVSLGLVTAFLMTVKDALTGPSAGHGHDH